ALQGSLDALAHMRDLMSANAPVPAARALLRQVRVLNGSAPAPVADAAASPATVEPAATDAPQAAPSLIETAPPDTLEAQSFVQAIEPAPVADLTPEATPETTGSPAEDAAAASDAPAAD